MTCVNTQRIALGAFVGGIIWVIWSYVVATVALRAHYQAAQAAGQILKQPRYPFFSGQWIVLLFLLSYILAWLYASVRMTRGGGPKTALLVGFVVGFALGFPGNFAMATWSPLSRVLPLWWMLEMWVGAILATLVAGWLYRDVLAP